MKARVNMSVVNGGGPQVPVDYEWPRELAGMQLGSFCKQMRIGDIWAKYVSEETPVNSHFFSLLEFYMFKVVKMAHDGLSFRVRAAAIMQGPQRSEVVRRAPAGVESNGGDGCVDLCMKSIDQPSSCRETSVAATTQVVAFIFSFYFWIDVLLVLHFLCCETRPVVT